MNSIAITLSVALSGIQMRSVIFSICLSVILIFVQNELIVKGTFSTQFKICDHLTCDHFSSHVGVLKDGNLSISGLNHARFHLVLYGNQRANPNILSARKLKYFECAQTQIF